MSVRWLDEGEVDLQAKRVFCRVDFNVPLDENGKITDDERIRAALPTIKLLIEKGAKVILGSHLGRPKGKVRRAMSLRPAAERLSELLDEKIVFADDCVGDGINRLAQQMKPGSVMVLENLRYHSGEEKNDDGFARMLAAFTDVYVNDAFGTAHRAHASTSGVVQYVGEKYGGLLLRREVDQLGKLLYDARRPYVAVLGGAKVSDKLGVLKTLLQRVDSIVIGGAMAYTFLQAQGEDVGASRVEDDRVQTARTILATAKERGVDVHLPIDHVVTTAFEADAPSRVVQTNGFTGEEMGLDIGPETRALFTQALTRAGTIFWNGPMGVFEWDAFSAGTMSVMQAVVQSDAFTVVGGGDSVAALGKAGSKQGVDHVSTGGGASLKYLEGKDLPGLVALRS